jgi:hypothetical protein
MPRKKVRCKPSPPLRLIRGGCLAMDKGKGEMSWHGKFIQIYSKPTVEAAAPDLDFSHFSKSA